MPYREATPEQKAAWDELTKRPWKPLDDKGPEILLRQVSPNTWQLLEGFRYEVPAKARRPGEPTEYAVPPHHLHQPPDKHNSTDLASVPPLLWWFIASHGKHTRPALLHDHLIDLDDVPDERADRLFRVALEESGVHFLRRWLMWAAVSLASLQRKRWGWGLVALFGLHLVAVFGVTIQALLYGLSSAWIPPLALAVAGFVWGLRRWPLSVFGLALIALPSVLILGAYIVNYVADLLFHRDAEFGQPYREESGPF
ncbi:MAG TPA: DUF1353 domain-containing protein [Gaiellaceae bacterium]|nr:DUF1353 domain-containing protein [Gaiellaceae bacterium]